jgi:hypothetical protein
MTFELLKVCRQANPTWIELRVMYVRSTVMDRHARWVSRLYLIKIIVFKKSNYLSFFISLFRFVFYFSYQSISFCFRWFRFAFVGFVLFRFHFVDFVSFRFVSFRFRWFRFVSFRFYFVSHFIGTPGTQVCSICIKNLYMVIRAF